MSRLNTPAELFQHLSLDPDMSPTSEEVRLRAVEVRDVLSSFDRNVLPSDYRTDIFANLDRPLPLRPQQPSEWTIQQDLNATLLQWGVYDEHAYKLIRRLQDPHTRTRCFQEKLRRRFNDIFEGYDVLCRSDLDIDEAHSKLNALADNFTSIVTAVEEDRQHRELGQVKIAGTLINALIGVCRRHDDISTTQPDTPSSRQIMAATAASDSRRVSMFRALIQDPGDQRSGGSLVLDVLEHYPPSVIGALTSDLAELLPFVQELAVPATYLARVERLSRRAEEYHTHATESSLLISPLGSPGAQEGGPESTAAGPGVGGGSTGNDDGAAPAAETTATTAGFTASPSISSSAGPTTGAAGEPGSRTSVKRTASSEGGAAATSAPAARRGRKRTQK